MSNGPLVMDDIGKFLTCFSKNEELSLITLNTRYSVEMEKFLNF